MKYLEKNRRIKKTDRPPGKFLAMLVETDAFFSEALGKSFSKTSFHNLRIDGAEKG